MFRIGEFARMNHISVSALRYYDDCGLMRPLHVDEATGYRYYGAEQMLTLHRIIALKESGMTLSEISGHLHQGNDRDGILSLFRHKVREAELAVKSEQERLRRLQAWIIAIEREEDYHMLDVTIKKVEPLLVAGLRDSIPSFDALGELWAELNSVIDACGGKKIVPCMMLDHHNQAQAPWDIEVIEPVAKPFTPTGRVKVYELPGCGNMASVIHKGPFETIGTTYAAFHQWFEQQGYKHGMPTREIYHKGDWMTDDPGEYITELQFPIGEG